MRKRTFSREIALKILYACDVGKCSIEKSVEDFWRHNDTKDINVKEFAQFLVEGIDKNRKEIDAVIEKYAANWKIDRMATIDRNILRIASFELIFAEDIPPKVTINEAIEMAKKYGNKDSGKFVNGVLDKVSKEETDKY
jgi:transcription antitermination factor NusB